MGITDSMTKCNILVKMENERRLECYGKEILSHKSAGAGYDSCI